MQFPSDRLAEQHASVQRIDDHLASVREATDRNTLEQQELIADLKGIGNRASVLYMIALGLLAASVVVNLVFYLHILKVLP